MFFVYSYCRLQAQHYSIIFFQIVKDGKFSHFLDGQDESHSNWMRFVNCSRCEDEQNLVAYQYRGEIYYRTYKPVTPGKELLVWYGESYAQDLGISPCDNQDHSISIGIKPTESTNSILYLSHFHFCLRFVCYKTLSNGTRHFALCREAQ